MRDHPSRRILPRRSSNRRSSLGVVHTRRIITLIIIGIVLMKKASESGSKELMALGLTFAIVGAIFVIDPERLRRSGA